MELNLQDLIDSTLGPVGHRDFYGNYVPSVHEVEVGTLGSLEYARNLRPDLHG